MEGVGFSALPASFMKERREDLPLAPSEPSERSAETIA